MLRSARFSFGTLRVAPEPLNQAEGSVGGGQDNVVSRHRFACGSSQVKPPALFAQRHTSFFLYSARANDSHTICA